MFTGSDPMSKLVKFLELRQGKNQIHVHAVIASMDEVVRGMPFVTSRDY